LFWLKDTRDKLKAATAEIAKMGRAMHKDAALVAQVTKERDAFERAAVQLQDQLEQRLAPIVGGHTDPADCPTYYDGCNCSVETLIHNIERAAKAETQLAEMRQAVSATADQCVVMQARVMMDHGDKLASHLMGQMAGMFRAVLE
jgi:hypothetical protein